MPKRQSEVNLQIVERNLFDQKDQYSIRKTSMLDWERRALRTCANACKHVQTRANV
jgi:hypothetical protein